jgi:NAD-dependent dihydropyrimidine dehydrogenase PreA subunit|tara:strand:- start:577 stop:1560 length:984 start_codon:yes stop_codon:yes gene_type:complete
VKKDFPSSELPFAYRHQPLSGNIINGLGETEKIAATQIFHGSGARELEWGKLELFFGLINPFKVSWLNLVNRWMLRNADGVISKNKRNVESLSDMTSEIKELAMKFGAGSVGISPMIKQALYKHGEINYTNAIVILYPMDGNEMKYVTTNRAGAETMRAYMEITKAAITISEEIRAMGWRARAYCEGADILHIPLAINAGLGELGKHGSLICREFGSSMRIATVLTDLPLNHDKPIDIAVDDLCIGCRRCTIDCPVDAISDDKQMVRGEEKWYVDFDKCVPYFTETAGCGICIEVCPWSKPDRGFSLSEKLLEKRAKKLNKEKFINI